jgi:hypothetical protein
VGLEYLIDSCRNAWFEGMWNEVACLWKFSIYVEILYFFLYTTIWLARFLGLIQNADE